MKHKRIVDQLSLEEKAMLCSGKDYWTTKAVRRLNLPSIMLTDGPHGLRKKDESGGFSLGHSVPATCFPTAVTTASSWDPELIEEMGKALGEECVAQGVSVLLGPGVNIKRSPTCGRNFEYFSEDPLLAGEMGAGFVNGVQSKGVGTSLKHFAANSQETRRMTINEVIDERTLREIYFPAFETTVKKSQPWTIMNAYNKLNGEYCSQNSWLQQDVLRGEWGFEGLIVTDWGASVDRDKGIRAGTDLEMPSSDMYGTMKIINAVKAGTLDVKHLDARVDTVVDLILKSKATLDKNSRPFSVEKHHQLAVKIAASSSVLLKNENKTLPIAKTSKVALIGTMAKEPRYQGAGSSLVQPTKVTNIYSELLKQGVKMTYADGYGKDGEAIDKALIDAAVLDAKRADVAVVVMGLTDEYESEGYEREHMRFPAAHNALVEAVAKANPNTVVVIQGGSPAEITWLDDVAAVLNTYLGGQAGGEAAVKLLLGDASPCGKLAETWPLMYEDNPTFGNYPGTPVTSVHKEGIYIGYRYYETAKKDVLFPFGYGLTYTKFEYSSLKLSKKKIDDTETLEATFKIKNVGDVDGTEIAQLYVSDQESTIYRPAKELKGFKKVFIKAGETKEVSITLDKRAFAYYNVLLGDWHVESGKFDIMIGSNVRDIALCSAVTVNSTVEAKIPDYSLTAPAYYGAQVFDVTDEQMQAVYGKKLPDNWRERDEPITLYNCLADAEDTKWGARICALIKKIMGLAVGAGAAGSDTNNGMMQAMATQIPIRNFISMSMGVFGPKMADGLLMVLNDDQNTLKGFGKLLSGLPSAVTKIKPLMKSI